MADGLSSLKAPEPEKKLRVRAQTLYNVNCCFEARWITKAKPWLEMLMQIFDLIWSCVFFNQLWGDNFNYLRLSKRFEPC